MPQFDFSIERIAQLARIDVPPEQVPSVSQQLNQMLEFVAILDELSLDGVEPFFGADDEAPQSRQQSQPIRDDVVCPSVDRDTILENAPDSDKEFYLVPPVFD